MESSDNMKKSSSDTAKRKPKKKKNTKHGFLKVLLRILIILIALALCTAGAVYLYSEYTKTHYEITFYQETSKKVSRNIRLAVISDIHNREYGPNNETLIHDISLLKPDLILFTGDMVLKSQDDYQPMLNLVSNLAGIAPCYGVMGNHEDERIYLGNDSELVGKFEAAGLKVLRNAQETVQIGSDRLQLIGISGTTQYGFEQYGARKFMDNTSIDPSVYCVVMAHVPVLFDSQLSDYRFDLGIAGHVHGGIINIPHFGGLYSSEEGFFPTYCSGKYTLANQQSLIISRGLGDSKFLPRINNLPELVVIDINCF